MAERLQPQGAIIRTTGDRNRHQSARKHATHTVIKFSATRKLVTARCRPSGHEQPNDGSCHPNQ
ncbi:hypothetical protein ACWC3Y_11235 [Streptomyces sp. NPDC001296]